MAAFLRRIGSPRLRDMPGLAGWIDEAARRYDLRAEWLVGLAQKEQSAITARSLSQHGQDWLMGYGCTEGPVYNKYRGARNQVFSAAAGIRGYLTPAAKYYVGEWVGRALTRDGETRTVRSLVEAVCLQYTPHWSTLQTVERIWRQFEFEDGEDAMPTTNDVARIARQVCARYAAGERGGIQIGAIHFELTDVAYCSEFVRECCEAAAQTADHGPLSTKYFGNPARETERKLRAQGVGISEAQAVPGDIVCFNGADASAYGHIAIWLGNNQVAENVNSFRVSTISAAKRARVSGWYHLPEFARVEPQYDEWAAEAVAWCQETGVMTGRTEGFAGREPVTRQELAVVAKRLYDLLHE